MGEVPDKGTTDHDALASGGPPTEISPDAKATIDAVKAGADDAGLQIAGLAKVDRIEAVTVGDRESPVEMGQAVTMTVRVAPDGRPLRPDEQGATSLLRIRTARVSIGGRVRWRTWAWLVDVETARVFEAADSGPSPQRLAELQDGRPFHEYADDEGYNDAAAALEADTPREATERALHVLVVDGRIVRPYERPPRRSTRLVAAIGTMVVAGLVAAVVALAGDDEQPAGDGANATGSEAPTEPVPSPVPTTPMPAAGPPAGLPAEAIAVILPYETWQTYDGATDARLDSPEVLIGAVPILVFDPNDFVEGAADFPGMLFVYSPGGSAPLMTTELYQRVGDRDVRFDATTEPGALHTKFFNGPERPGCHGPFGLGVPIRVAPDVPFFVYTYTSDGELIFEANLESVLGDRFFFTQWESVFVDVGVAFTLLQEDGVWEPGSEVPLGEQLSTGEEILTGFGSALAGAEGITCWF